MNSPHSSASYLSVDRELFQFITAVYFRNTNSSSLSQKISSFPSRSDNSKTNSLSSFWEHPTSSHFWCWVTPAPSRQCSSASSVTEKTPLNGSSWLPLPIISFPGVNSLSRSFLVSSPSVQLREMNFVRKRNFLSLALLSFLFNLDELPPFFFLLLVQFSVFLSLLIEGTNSNK